MRAAIALITLLASTGFVVVVAAQNTATQTMTCVLRIEGMSCSACAAAVEKAALKIPGVTAAKVSQPAGTAEITYDATKVAPEAIAKSITKKTGFAAKPQPR